VPWSSKENSEIFRTNNFFKEYAFLHTILWYTVCLILIANELSKLQMKYFINLFNGLICCLVFCNIQTASSQCMSNCEIQCTGQINVSLDQNCEAEITPAMGGVGIEPVCNSYYTVELYDQYGNLMPTDTVDFSHVGELLTYKIIEPECGNACWGNLLVDYKLAPVIDCPADITIPCAMLDFLCFPPATGGCVGFQVTLASETSTKLDCDPNFTKIIERTYKACDDFGNCSTCTQTISLERLDFDNIKFPEPFTVGNGNAISCCDSNLVYDDNGFPIPFLFDPLTGSGSGVPVLCLPLTGSGASGTGVTGLCIDGMFPITGSGSGSAMIPLVPRNIPGTNSGSNLDVCNAIVTYTDLELPSTNCKRKIARTFEIREWWCSDEIIRGDIQLIEIVDDIPPEVTCPLDYTVTTDHNCSSSVSLPPIKVFDKCGSEVTVKIQTPNGITDGNGGIVELNLGNNLISYIATDACKNQNNCQVNVTVQDNTGPVTVCETTKVVSLSNSTNSIVYAEPFDNGSWDECKLDRFEVRRMDSTCVATEIFFGDYVTFCCSDVGNPDVMVVFRAYDKAGNFNDCMVNVEVQDKSTPSLTCPDDVTINCTETYDLNNLSLTFGNPDIGTNCAGQNIIETPLTNVDQCGFGTISRKFQILDSQGNAVRTCTQDVTITNNSPFLPIDIIWPLDYEAIGECSIDKLRPEDLNSPYDYPTFVDVNVCAQLGYDYDDRVFQGNNGLGSCTTIERTWTVINWCGDADGNGNFDQFVIPKPQIITIINNTNPVIIETGPLTFTSQSIDCTSGPISVSLTATDDCDNLNYRYELVDVDNNIIKFGDTNFVAATLPVGIYTLKWNVNDGCGNFDIYNQPIEVINTKLPTPVCINGLSANLVLMDLDMDGAFDAEMVEIWASDFDAGSSHSCGNPVVVSFSADTTDKVKFFDCNNIGINPVRMYVTDVNTGLQDFCSTFIEIQDNNGDNICNSNNGTRVAVTGDIFTEDVQPVDNVELSLITDVLVDITDETGSYAFSDMPMGGSYVLNAYKDIEYLNGVSTLDLIFIQKHILGEEMLDSPYKIIAADADGSQSITAIDLIHLRKLILGIYDELPSNDSWRFIDAQQTFIDELNPWITDLKESYTIDQLSTDMKLNFIGVKIGDVNGSVVANANSTGSEKRSNRQLSFFINDQKLNAGETYKLNIYSDDYNDILGWQTTLRFDNASIELLDITSEELGIQKDKNTNFLRSEEGMIAISYNADDAFSLSENATVMEVTVLVKEDMNSADLFDITSDMTRTEAYGDSGQLLDMRWETKTITAASIVSVSPNPWSEKTSITIEVPTDGEAQWEFYNVDGKLLYSRKDYYITGTHNVALRRSDINSSGIIYAKLITESGIAEYKMIVL